MGSDPENPGLVRIYKTPDKPNDRAWHTDATWREKPPMGCVLRCVECPPVGGDTMWANMDLAYEKLPEDIKTRIAGLRARHSIEASFGAAMPIEKRLALHAQFRRRASGRSDPSGNGREGFVRERIHDPFHQFPREKRPLRPGLRSRRRPTAALSHQPGADPGISGALALGPNSVAMWDNRPRSTMQ